MRISRITRIYFPLEGFSFQKALQLVHVSNQKVYVLMYDVFVEGVDEVEGKKSELRCVVLCYLLWYVLCYGRGRRGHSPMNLMLPSIFSRAFLSSAWAASVCRNSSVPGVHRLIGPATKHVETHNTTPTLN